MYSAGIIFHLLLLGTSPFYGTSYKEVLTINKKANIKLTGAEYLSVPSKAFDLLSKMLIDEPSERITAKEALEHPFFKEE